MGLMESIMGSYPLAICGIANWKITMLKIAKSQFLSGINWPWLT